AMRSAGYTGFRLTLAADRGVRRRDRRVPRPRPGSAARVLRLRTERPPLSASFGRTIFSGLGSGALLSVSCWRRTFDWLRNIETTPKPGVAVRPSSLDPISVRIDYEGGVLNQRDRDRQRIRRRAQC